MGFFFYEVGFRSWGEWFVGGVVVGVEHGDVYEVFYNVLVAGE